MPGKNGKEQKKQVKDTELSNTIKASRDEKLAKYTKSIKPLSAEAKTLWVNDILGVPRMVETKPGEFHEAKINVEDLKINREHLRQVRDKYGAPYAYDVYKMASLNPKLLMNLALKGNEEVFSCNQTAQEFLADKNSINTEKALEFFAEAAVPLEVLDRVRTKIEMSEARHYAVARINSRRKAGMTAPASTQEQLLAQKSTKRETTQPTNVNTIDTNIR